MNINATLIHCIDVALVKILQALNYNPQGISIFIDAILIRSEVLGKIIDSIQSSTLLEKVLITFPEEKMSAFIDAIVEKPKALEKIIKSSNDLNGLLRNSSNPTPLIEAIAKNPICLQKIINTISCSQLEMFLKNLSFEGQSVVIEAIAKNPECVKKIIEDNIDARRVLTILPQNLKLEWLNAIMKTPIVRGRVIVDYYVLVYILKELREHEQLKFIEMMDLKKNPKGLVVIEDYFQLKQLFDSLLGKSKLALFCQLPKKKLLAFIQDFSALKGRLVKLPEEDRVTFLEYLGKEHLRKLITYQKDYKNLLKMCPEAKRFGPITPFDRASQKAAIGGVVAGSTVAGAGLAAAFFATVPLAMGSGAVAGAVCGPIGMAVGCLVGAVIGFSVGVAAVGGFYFFSNRLNKPKSVKDDNPIVPNNRLAMA